MDSNWESHLRGMLQYAAASGCRRAALCRHFGEAPPPCHQGCDCCRRAAAGDAAAAGGVAAAGSGGRKKPDQQHHHHQQQQQQELKDVTEAAKGVVQTLQVRLVLLAAVVHGSTTQLLQQFSLCSAALDQRVGCATCITRHTRLAPPLCLCPAGLAGQREAGHPDTAGGQVAKGDARWLPGWAGVSALGSCGLLS